MRHTGGPWLRVMLVRGVRHPGSPIRRARTSADLRVRLPIRSATCADHQQPDCRCLGRPGSPCPLSSHGNRIGNPVTRLATASAARRESQRQPLPARLPMAAARNLASSVSTCPASATSRDRVSSSTRSTEPQSDLLAASMQARRYGGAIGQIYRQPGASGWHFTHRRHECDRFTDLYRRRAHSTGAVHLCLRRDTRACLRHQRARWIDAQTLETFADAVHLHGEATRIMPAERSSGCSESPHIGSLNRQAWWHRGSGRVLAPDAPGPLETRSGPDGLYGKLYL